MVCIPWTVARRRTDEPGHAEDGAGERDLWVRSGRSSRGLACHTPQLLSMTSKHRVLGKYRTRLLPDHPRHLAAGPIKLGRD